MPLENAKTAEAKAAEADRARETAALQQEAQQIAWLQGQPDAVVTLYTTLLGMIIAGLPLREVEEGIVRQAFAWAKGVDTAVQQKQVPDWVALGLQMKDMQAILSRRNYVKHRGAPPDMGDEEYEDAEGEADAR